MHREGAEMGDDGDDGEDEGSEGEEEVEGLEEEDENGESEAGGDGAGAERAQEQGKDEPERDGGPGGDWCEDKKAAECGGDAAAAPAADVNREDMANDHEDDDGAGAQAWGDEGIDEPCPLAGGDEVEECGQCPDDERTLGEIGTG